MNPILSAEYRAQLADPLFAEPAVFRPDDKDAFTVSVYFDEKFVELDPETNVPILSTMPACLVFIQDLPARFLTGGQVAPGMPLRIRERDFRVSEFRADGLGAALLRLHENPSAGTQTKPYLSRKLSGPPRPPSR